MNVSSPTITKSTEFTVQDAAEKFGKDPSHIRRVCIDLDLGDVKYGRVRILKETDLRKLAAHFEEHGRNRQKREPQHA